MSWATCKYCYEKIVWAPMPAGNWLPMDPEGGGLHDCTPFERYPELSPPRTARRVQWSGWVLGIRFVAEPRGLRVTEVVHAGQAATAGIQAGDVIVKGRDQAVHSGEEFNGIRDSVPPGGELSLTIERQSTTMTVVIPRPRW
jgi:predicted metalloprotease with PDZ domain